MEFREFKVLFQNNFYNLVKDSTHLFEVKLDPDYLWNLYLDSFPPGTNEIYRERREYDCGCCRQFIKSFGNVVVIKENKIKTIWDFEINDDKFQYVADALNRYVKSKFVSGVYVSKFKKIGTDCNYEQIGNSMVTWEHFHLELPTKFVDKSNKSLGDIKGTYKDTRNVFKRSLDEITEDSLLTVLELIAQNSLYKGEEWESILTSFLALKQKYDSLSSTEQSNYAWVQSVKVGGSLGRIKNCSIGTLLMDISQGVPLDEAVRKYEVIVAPSNYKRPKPVFTQRMLDDAKKTIEQLGYSDSLKRRFANIDDISVNNIIFSNKDVTKKLNGDSVFDEMSAQIPVNPKKFSKVEEVSIEDFTKNVLPTAGELEVFLENKHATSMVSLIAPENKDTKTMFKWDNSFGWAYSGNITDSDMKENVKSAGGNVDGVLRFSIQWNDTGYNPNDFDAHCTVPSGGEIYYARKVHHRTKGQLDVDIITPQQGKVAVENITWGDKSALEYGTYRFFVINYSHRGGRGGFKAEVEFDGQIYSSEYNKELRNKERVDVAEVTYSKTNGFSIKESIPSELSSREMWGLSTNQFVPVSVMMFSPNWWDGQQGIGNKHYFFMLKDCINPEQPNSIYNEFLKEDLLKHRKVFEALGAKMKVDNDDNQLSGLGFSSTQRKDVLVRVKGQTERVLKIKF